MTDRRYQRSSVNGSKLTKKIHASPAVAYGNNYGFDEKERQGRKVALQEASIALGERATFILNSQEDPETLDLRSYAGELNDVVLNELANQLQANLTRMSKAEQTTPQIQKCQYYSTVILSGCEKFTPVRGFSG